MDSLITDTTYEQIIRDDVASLCRRTKTHWIRPISETLKELQKTKIHAVFFGGTVRSLLLSRILTGRMGRPRDIDIVIAGTSIEEIRNRFSRYPAKINRFGGLQLKRKNWLFDVWPLSQTWAFNENQNLIPDFGTLPYTTFLNLEAIAVDVWPAPGRPRRIYKGNGQFYKGLSERFLEINYENNPYPSLCIVRSLIFAASTDFSIGPKLASYLAKRAETISEDELHSIQMKHYGHIRFDAQIMKEWLTYIKNRIKNASSRIVLPKFRQLSLWDDNVEIPILNFHVLSNN